MTPDQNLLADALDALHQWMVAQTSGDLDELRNARAARDEVLRKAGRPVLIEFQGRIWWTAHAVQEHTCEGCHAQKADGVPCGVAGRGDPPPCGDGILNRWVRP